MNILVFGAGNRAGRYLIERALEQDHYVTAFIPHTEENEFPVHKNLLIVSGAISDYNAIDEAMQGQEIVIEAMIPRDAEPTNFIAASTHNIIKAMHANRVWRLVILSEVGAAGSLHQGPLIYRLWMWLRQMKSGYSLTERTIREAFVQKSGLEWTIVRSVIIKSSSSFNGDPDISFSVKKTLRRPSIAGVSLAAFLLHTAVEHTFINKIIGISDK